MATVWGRGAEPEDEALYANARQRVLERQHYDDVISIDSHTEKVEREERKDRERRGREVKEELLTSINRSIEQWEEDSGFQIHRMTPSSEDCMLA